MSDLRERLAGAVRLTRSSGASRLAWFAAMGLMTMQTLSSVATADPLTNGAYSVDFHAVDSGGGAVSGGSGVYEAVVSTGQAGGVGFASNGIYEVEYGFTAALGAVSIIPVGDSSTYDSTTGTFFMDEDEPLVIDLTGWMQSDHGFDASGSFSVTEVTDVAGIVSSAVFDAANSPATRNTLTIATAVNETNARREVNDDPFEVTFDYPTDPDREIVLELTLEDAIGNVSSREVNLAVVYNPPGAPSADVDPNVPYDPENLVCDITPGGKGAQRALEHTYRWTNYDPNSGPAGTKTISDGPTDEESSALPASNTAVDETWYCRVRSHDGREFSEWTTAAPVGPIQEVPSSSITLQTTSSGITLGQSIQLSGTINPAATGAAVFFDSTTTPAGGTSTKPSSTLTNQSSQYTQTFVPNEAGQWGFLASWDGNFQLAGDTSDGANVNVARATPTLSLTLSHDAEQLGFDELTAWAELDATLPLDRRDLLGGIQIRLDMREPDNQTPANLPLLATTALNVETGEYIATFSPSAFSNAGITFDEAGTWQFQATMLQTTNFNAANTPNYDNSLTPRLTIKDGAGYAILIVGALDDATGPQNTDNNTDLGEGQREHTKTMDFVYRTLIDRGFTHDDIWYMREPAGSILPPPTFSGNPTVVDDPTPSQADLQSRITNWARTKMNAKPAPLYLVAIDHGLDGKFYVFDTATQFGEQRIVTPQELSNWYNTLQSNLNGVRGDATLNQAADQDLILVYGACHSGSFIPLLSAPGRVLVTSSRSTELSHRGAIDPLDGLRDGELFVTELFRELRLGNAMKTAFEIASARVEGFTKESSNGADPNAVVPQRPLLDDDGNGAGHISGELLNQGNGDGVRSTLVSLGFGQSNAAGSVGLTSVTPTLTLNENALLPVLTAHATDALELHQAWIEVKAPSYDGGDPAATGTVPTGGENLAQFQQEVVLYHFDSVQNAPGNTDPPVNGDYTFPGSLEDDESGLTLAEATETPGTYQVYYFIKDAETQEVASFLVTTILRNSGSNDAPPAVTLLSPDSEEVVTELGVAMAWTASVDPDGDPVTYQLEIDQASGPEQSAFVEADITVGDIAATSAVQTLSAGQTYFWRVIPVDSFGAKPPTHAVRRFSIPAGNPGLSGFIGGTVSDVSGTPISNFTVKIKAGATDLQNLLPIDAGAYLSAGIENAGAYDVVVTATGYLTQTASGVVVEEGGFTEANFVMVASGATTYSDATTLRNGFRALDLDGNGWLTRTETGLNQTRFNALDTNGDGKLTLAELVAASAPNGGSAEIAWVKFSHSGPENGQETSPFNTIEEGAAHVKPAGEVRVVSGTIATVYTGSNAMGFKPQGLASESFTAKVPSGTAKIGARAARDAWLDWQNGNTDHSEESNYERALREFWRRVWDAWTGVSDGNEHTTGFSESTGGGDALDFEALYYEPALPYLIADEDIRTDENGAVLRIVSGREPMAIRLVSADGIDTATLWAEVPDGLRADVAVDWITHGIAGDPVVDGAGALNDVWVRVTPSAEWSEILRRVQGTGAVIQVTVGTDAMQSEKFVFAVEEGDERAGLTPIDSEVLPPLVNSVGNAYRIDPPSVYDEAHEVVLPIPPGVDAAALRVAYLGGVESPVWYRIEQVVGFAAGWRTSVDENGSPVVVIRALHGGVVRLVVE